jgi:hypothetical protein
MVRRPYQLRTWLREHVPGPSARFFPPGPRDCGEHEWYRLDEHTDVCRHCLVGRREHIPIPLTIGGSEWAGLINGISHGSRASAEVLVERLRETEASVAIAANEARSKMRGNGAGDVRRQLDAFADRA